MADPALLTRIAAIVRRTGRVHAAIRMTEDSRLVEDLGIDSLDLVSVYLAILYQTDPTPVTLLAMLKERLARSD